MPFDIMRSLISSEIQKKKVPTNALLMMLIKDQHDLPLLVTQNVKSHIRTPTPWKSNSPKPDDSLPELCKINSNLFKGLLRFKHREFSYQVVLYFTKQLLFNDCL